MRIAKNVKLSKIRDGVMTKVVLRLIKIVRATRNVIIMKIMKIMRETNNENIMKIMKIVRETNNVIIMKIMKIVDIFLDCKEVELNDDDEGCDAAGAIEHHWNLVRLERKQG